MRDPYSILGVGKNADQREIKAAWRNTAKALHPDQNPDDPQAASRFTEAGRAYDLLKDPNKRRLFDEARARSAGGKEKTFMEQRADKARAEAEARAAAEAKAAAEARARAAAAQAARNPPPKEEPVEETMSKIFGANKSGEARESDPQPEPKPTRQAEEPQKAARHTDEPQPAPENPAEPRPSPSPALELISYVIKRLTRQVPAPDKAPDLAIDVPVSIEDILQRANQSVTLPDGAPLTIRIPDDARDGTQIRLEGQGHRLPHVKRGDVVATLRIRPHSWYRPHGYDLLTHVDIDIENAVLGCEATVETPDGQTKVTIPPWTGSSYKVTIAGKGLPKGHGMRGNLIAEVRVLLWDRPDQKVIDLMRSLREGLYL
jgi:DnaJ-class molecular chaperone